MIALVADAVAAPGVNAGFGSPVPIDKSAAMTKASIARIPLY
jgi:hypothetical protein